MASPTPQPRDDRPFFADPHSRIGGWLWDLSKRWWAAYAPLLGFSIFMGLLWAAEKLTAHSPVPDGVVGIVAIAVSLSMLIGSLAVSNMHQEQLCTDCSSPNHVSSNYCSHCGADLPEVVA